MILLCVHPVARGCESAQSRLRSSSRRPGAPAGYSRCERCPDTASACAASSTAVPPTCVPLPPWPPLSASGDSDADTLYETRDRNAPRGLRRFHLQHAQHAVALLGDRTQLLPSARGVLARNQTQITGHLLAAREAADIAQGQHVGQRRDRTDSGLGLKKQRHFVSLSFGFYRLVERFDLLVAHRHQL